MGPANKPKEVTVNAAMNAYVGNRLRELRGRQYGLKKWDRSIDSIAEETGISKPQVHSLIKDGTGLGPTVERAVADKWFGGSIDRLHEAAMSWFEKQPRAVTADDRYDAMAAVRAMARAERFSAEFIRSFEAHLDFDGQPSADDLWSICKGEYARWRSKHVPNKGNALAGLDDVAPRPRKK